MKTKKILALALAAVLLVAVSVAGTLAYLVDSTKEIENTFTKSNVDIDLTETKTDFQMIPGATIEKDPIVTVKAGSEDCWVFVKVVESDDLLQYIDYDIAEGWKELDGVSGVYYREAKAGDTFSVLAGDEVTVLGTVTNQMMDNVTDENVKLTFTAYACQKEGFATAKDAWDEASKAAIYPAAN